MNVARQIVRVAVTTLVLATLVACHDLDPASEAVAVRAGASEAQPTEQDGPAVPVDAVFEANVVYVGVDIEPPKLTPGDRAIITQYWRLNTPLSAAERRAFAGWVSYLRVEGPYSRGVIAAERLAPDEALGLERWAAGAVIREQFALQVPDDWAEPAVWLFAGISGRPADARPTQSLKVVQGPDDDGWRIRALTVRVKRPWSGGLPSWVMDARPSALSKFVE